MLTSQEILTAYFKLYSSHGHVQIPNMSLVPEGDSTLLFVNSGMFPLVPYLSGEPHPLGKRLMNVQRSLRFEDIEEVGISNRHTTCFHMIGNWSLGDYFKKEQLPWIYEFFIEKLGLDPLRMYATVFEGDNYAPKDTESIEIIKTIFKSYGIDAQEGTRIFPYGKKDNWWQRGDAPGELGGPDSELFYYLGSNGNGEGKNPADNQDTFIEIGNSVFMQYRKTTSGGWEELPQKNVDFGGGLERIALAVQKKEDVYETDNFYSVITELEKLTHKKYKSSPEVTRAMRIITDHMRAASFLAMDGVIPSNKDQGYVLRRYLRRIVRFGKQLGLTTEVSSQLVPVIADMLRWIYPELSTKKEEIQKIFSDEEEKFARTLTRAEQLVDKALLKDVTTEGLAKLAFDYYQSYGTPPDMLVDKARENGENIDQKKFEKTYRDFFKSHQELSRKGAEAKFKGGLANHSTEVVQFHTVTHLLHQALRTILGTHVQQYGSNITNERLRFDFSHDAPLIEDEIKSVEKLVNETIQKKLLVQFAILPKEDAEKTGALHFFKEKYGERVKVYFIGKDMASAFSKEYCGGPHVSNLSELAPTLHIYKQESVGKGVRRIYARFEKLNVE